MMLLILSNGDGFQCSSFFRTHHPCLSSLPKNLLRSLSWCDAVSPRVLNHSSREVCLWLSVLIHQLGERMHAIATKKRNPVRFRFLIYYMCDFLFESFLFYDDAFAVEVYRLEVHDDVCAVLLGLPLVGSHDVVVRLFVEPCA